VDDDEEEEVVVVVVRKVAINANFASQMEMTLDQTKIKVLLMET
jgi:hypothetical protein